MAWQSGVFQTGAPPNTQVILHSTRRQEFLTFVVILLFLLAYVLMVMTMLMNMAVLFHGQKGQRSCVCRATTHNINERPWKQQGAHRRAYGNESTQASARRFGQLAEHDGRANKDHETVLRTTGSQRRRATAKGRDGAVPN